jgi:hypothetical protein
MREKMVPAEGIGIFRSEVLKTGNFKTWKTAKLPLTGTYLERGLFAHWPILWPVN